MAEQPAARRQRRRPAGEAARAGTQSATLAAPDLLRAVAELVAMLDPAQLYPSLVTRFVDALPMVQAGLLWVFDRSSGRLRMRAAAGLAALPALQSCTLRPGEGMAGQAFQRGEAQINEVRLGYRELAPPGVLALQHLADTLPRRLADSTVPLRVAGEIVGVLELLSLEQADQPVAWQPMTRADLPDLQTYATIAATAIKNAQLYDEARRSAVRLKAFDAVVTAISTAADLPDLVRSVLDVVLELVPNTSGALLLLDTEQDRLELGAQHGLPPGGAQALQSTPVADSPCEEVVHYGQPMLRPLLEERGEAAFLGAGLAGCAYLPLLAGGTVAGVLALYGDASLTHAVDREMLMPICNQVGFAVANVRLYDDSQSERRKLNTVVTSIAEGVLLCDARGRLTLANQAALDLLRLDSLPFEQPLAAMPDFYRMRDLDDQELTLEQLPFARALAGEIFQNYRLQLRGASGDRSVMSFSGAPARADDGTIEGAVVVFRDVTTSQKLERAKDEFLAVAAHELRSPLAAVRSYADLLLRREQKRSEADPRDIHGLTILTQQVSHMLRMVDNLLDVSRIDAGQLDLQLQPVELVSLTSQVIDQQRHAAGTRTIEIDSEADEMRLEGDSLRIRQVLTNLISNAIRYSPADGAIVVRLRRATIEGDDGPHPAAQISITDTGIGMSPDQQQRLFKRYYRANNHRAEGLGLGLYLSLQFVQMHGGRIWVESTEGNGTTFSFTLPLSQPVSTRDQKSESGGRGFRLSQ